MFGNVVHPSPHGNRQCSWQWQFGTNPVGDIASKIMYLVPRFAVQGRDLKIKMHVANVWNCITICTCMHLLYHRYCTDILKIATCIETVHTNELTCD